MWRWRYGLLCSVCVALAGCTGELQTYWMEQGGDDPGQADMEAMVVPGADMLPQDTEDMSRDDGGDLGELPVPPSGPVTMPIRHVTPLQYSNMIRDLFDGRITSDLFDDADPAAAISGYSTEPGANVATERSVRQLFDSAEVVALASVDIMPELLPCAANPVDAACVDTLLDDYAGRAFRRPLQDAERAMLHAAYDEALADGFSEHESLAVVLQTMLQMPQFLYVTEVGVARAQVRQTCSN